MSEFTEAAKELCDMLSEEDKVALSQVPAQCDCSVADLEQAREDIRENGMPPTPARWQRRFRWGYRRSSTALATLRAEQQNAESEAPSE